MNTDFRNRAFLPVVMPLAILLGVVGLIVLFALILLYNTRVTALVLATVAAAAVLFTVALASSKDRLNAGQKGALGLAAFVPVLIGGIVALGVGGIPAEDLNINREPHLVIPEDAPLIAAENSQTFCLPSEGGTCEPTESWEVDLGSLDTNVVVFDNREAGVSHNVAFYAYEGGEADTSQAFYNGAIFPGVATQVYDVGDSLPAGEVYFQCDVHPNMQGVATVVLGEGGGDATPEPVGEDG